MQKHYTDKTQCKWQISRNLPDNNHPPAIMPVTHVAKSGILSDFFSVSSTHHSQVQTFQDTFVSGMLFFVLFIIFCRTSDKIIKETKQHFLQLHLGVLQSSKHLNKSEITLEVGGWVQDQGSNLSRSQRPGASKNKVRDSRI